MQKPAKRSPDAWNSVSRLFAVLYNLRASLVRKFGFLLEISPKTGFWQFRVLGAKTGKKVTRRLKLGFQVVRGALQPQSKFGSKIRIFTRNFAQNRFLTISCFRWKNRQKGHQAPETQFPGCSARSTTLEPSRSTKSPVFWIWYHFYEIDYFHWSETTPITTPLGIIVCSLIGSEFSV